MINREYQAAQYIIEYLAAKVERDSETIMIHDQEEDYDDEDNQY